MWRIIEGWEFLVSEDWAVSFYTYVTTILAELAVLWSFFPEMAFPFTILLALCILNVIAGAHLKNYYEGRKEELICAAFYAIAFLEILIMGICVNVIAAIILLMFPIVITAMIVYGGRECFWIKGKLYKKKMGSRKSCSKLEKWVANIILLLLFLFPLACFIVALTYTELTLFWKIAIPIVYILVCVPFMGNMEDDWNVNIFEIVYQITYLESQKAEDEEE